MDRESIAIESASNAVCNKIFSNIKSMTELEKSLQI